jgi:hypothetical protein
MPGGAVPRSHLSRPSWRKTPGKVQASNGATVTGAANGEAANFSIGSNPIRA